MKATTSMMPFEIGDPVSNRSDDQIVVKMKSVVDHGYIFQKYRANGIPMHMANTIAPR